MPHLSRLRGGRCYVAVNIVSLPTPVENIRRVCLILLGKKMLCCGTDILEHFCIPSTLETGLRLTLFTYTRVSECDVQLKKCM